MLLRHDEENGSDDPQTGDQILRDSVKCNRERGDEQHQSADLPRPRKNPIGNMHGKDGLEGHRFSETAAGLTNGEALFIVLAENRTPSHPPLAESSPCG